MATRRSTLTAEDLELRQTAYHEAGHAVLYALFDLPFDRAEVFTAEYPAPPELPDYAGIVRSDWMQDCPRWAMPWQPDCDWELAIRHWNRLICISLAGEVAESIYLGRKAPHYVGTHDRRDIRNIVQHLMGFSLRDMKGWVDPLRTLTLELLRLPAVWDAVTAVAEKLIAQNVLTHRQVRSMVRRTCAHGPHKPTRGSKCLHRLHQLAPILAQPAKMGRARRKKS